ncbi:MAG: helix-turn-helix domain-containing protein [Clostridia bacterium]|nr:helix-turn-helix domain-containing protein [Clostridia bacterium]
MGSQPTKAADNMYCQCRLAASKYNDKLKSREGAAEMLGLSSSTLASYELGLTKVVPVESIMLMAELYGAPELKRWYCNNMCPLGEELPPVEIADLDRLTVKLLSVLKCTAQIKEDMLNIAADGVVSADEQPKMESVLAALKDIVAVSSSLMLWAEKNIGKGV